MKRLMYLLSFLIMINPLLAQGSLKVMTYNLQGMKPGTDPETRLFHIIQNLKELNPDVIGLQEINEPVRGGEDDNQAKIIADSLSAYFGITYYCYYSLTHLAWDNQFREYVGIISKHPVEQEGYHQLVPGVFPRKVVWNYINTPLGMINFFNTHLSFNSRSVRVQQVQQIREYIDQQEIDFLGVASLLTGDFNDTPESEPILLLTNTGTDTFYFDTYHEVNLTSSGYTSPAGSPSSRIDFIFYKNTGSLTIDTSFVVMTQPYDGIHYCSDHLGVMTILSEDTTGIGNHQFVNIPKKSKLSQIYPNPFNPITEIRYALPKDCRVRLEIYNILGQRVATLVDGKQKAGYKKAKWNAGSLSSGIYFYRLKAGDFMQTRKMVLLK